MKHSSLLIGLVGIVIAIGLVIIFGKSKSDLSTNPSACVNASLSQGASGSCVADLQNLLNWNLYGIDSPNYKPISGQFTTTTTSEVKQFQASNTLIQSGSLNKLTWEKLCQATDPSTTWTAAATAAGCKL